MSLTVGPIRLFSGATLPEVGSGVISTLLRTQGFHRLRLLLKSDHSVGNPGAFDVVFKMWPKADLSGYNPAASGQGAPISLDMNGGAADAAGYSLVSAIVLPALCLPFFWPYTVLDFDSQLAGGDTGFVCDAWLDCIDEVGVVYVPKVAEVGFA